jgi:hypothetical protein
VLKKEANKCAAEEQFCKRASQDSSSELSVVLSIHTTSCSSERNWSIWGHIHSKARNRMSMKHAGKVVYIKQNSPNTAVLPSDGAKNEWEVCLQLLEDEQ